MFSAYVVGVPATVYVPRGCHGNPAILVYFHGGGMVIGSRASVDATCRTIAMKSPCIVVSVGYRLAPEHKFPASFEDAETATKWVLENKLLVGGSADSKVGVGGDSAGGTLAATVCHEVPGLAFQILVYPRVEYKGETQRLSATEYEDGPILSKDVVSWYRNHFLRSLAENCDVLLNPYLRAGFDRLPPALLVVAECDPLRDESYDYQKKMQEAGVTAELLQVNGACHSFFTKPGCTYYAVAWQEKPHFSRPYFRAILSRHGERIEWEGLTVEQADFHGLSDWKQKPDRVSSKSAVPLRTDGLRSSYVDLTQTAKTDGKLTF